MIASAIESFEQAIRADSTYARAYGGLAEAYWVLPSYSAAPVKAARERSAAAANKALRIDSTLAGAHATRGALYADAGRWTEAERAFRRAIALEPDYATAHHWFSRFLVDPLYDPLRTHPRFAALLRRMNVGCTRPAGFAGDVPRCAYLTAAVVSSADDSSVLVHR